MGVRTVGVAGLGIQGRDIVACLLGYGFRVIGYTRSRTTHERARQYVAEGARELIDRAALPDRPDDPWFDRYEATDSFERFAACEFVIETIVEDIEAKRQTFERIEAVVGPEVPIASNTSSLPISRLQANRARPERFVGMHWGEPAHVSRFLEIIRGEQTSEVTLAAAVALGRAIGKEPSLVQKDVPAFVANRIGYAIYREALSLLELGVADVETIDRSFRNTVAFWSTIGGPFREMDLTGGPALYASVMKGVFPHLSNTTDIPRVMEDLAADDARGIANGRGFYQYTDQEAKDWERLFRENAWTVREMLNRYFPVAPDEE